jgi:hypothetical protein
MARYPAKQKDLPALQMYEIWLRISMAIGCVAFETHRHSWSPCRKGNIVEAEDEYTEEPSRSGFSLNVKC